MKSGRKRWLLTAGLYVLPFLAGLVYVYVRYADTIGKLADVAIKVAVTR